MSTISPDQLQREVEKALQEWADVTEDAAGKGVQETAKKVVEELHSAHPAGSERYGSWARYNASWAALKLKFQKGAYSIVVHNKKHYQLAHLLEKGHALRGGGRARAFPHIAPIADRAENELLTNIKKHIK